MSLFRGGKRGCDMRATLAGTVAVLKFSEFEVIYKELPSLAHKLMMSFGREAYLHTIFSQNSAFSKVRGEDGHLGMSEQMLFDPATNVLTKRGWTVPECQGLLSLQLLDVDQVRHCLLGWRPARPRSRPRRRPCRRDSTHARPPRCQQD